MFDYKDAIENAINLAESCPANDSPCIHSGNTLLYFFLRCVDWFYSMLANLFLATRRGLMCCGMFVAEKLWTNERDADTLPV
jgi:hypothetical protein